MHFKRYIKYGILAFCLFNCACSKDKNLNDNTYFGSKVMILGHRGMGTGYYKPGNTSEGILPVFGIGADGSELDIQMTKDSVLVLFHDHNLNPQTTCNGRIYEQNWSDIKQCKYYALQNMVFVNSADEFFNKVPNLKDYYFSFDCKIDSEAPDYALYQFQFLRAVQRLCIKYQMQDHVFIEGDLNLLQRAQLVGLTNKLFLNSDLSKTSIDDAVNNQFSGISASIDAAVENISYAHQQNLFVMLWSPDNYTQNKATLDLQADIIQSDDPVSILKIVNRYNYEYIIP